MWRLYAERGKAVAVETGFDNRFKNAILQALFTFIRSRIWTSLTWHFNRKTVLLKGIPLLKRISYRHEQEVRAFIGKVAPNPRAGVDAAFWKPGPIRLPVDVKVLLKAIHVSPYAGEPFPSSVAKICEAFGLDLVIVQPSHLLTGEEELLDRFSL
jgi:hypothetical protein